MLSCLKPKDRSIFLKLFYEDMDVEDVSREMGNQKISNLSEGLPGKKKASGLETKRRFFDNE